MLPELSEVIKKLELKDAIVLAGLTCWLELGAIEIAEAVNYWSSNFDKGETTYVAWGPSVDKI